jgi:UDP-GlcNAc:undecaprenyl-phosphate GlcNAc-1-phosphate transferase
MSPQYYALVLLVIAVFCLSVFGTRMMHRLAGRYNWVVLPRADRWHKKPTALHGGVGFYPAFFLGICWVLVQTFSTPWSIQDILTSPPPAMRLTAAILLGSLLMFGVGLCDDLKQLRPATKLLCQLVAASLFVGMGGVFPMTGIVTCDILVTYFWFVGITNAVNMLDNMDGLASGVTILAATTVVILAIQTSPEASRSALAVPVGLVFIAALGGFWVHNRPPASIFMGDSGSLFIGYVLAALAVPSPLNGFMGIWTVGGGLGPVLALLIPATVLAIPIFDTTLVTITRAWRAQKASQGGRDHSSHRLVGLGLSEKKAVWVLYALAALGGTVAVLLQQFPDQSLPLFGFFGLILVLTGVYLGHVKVQIADPGRVPPAWTPLVTTILYKRHAAEVLLDTMLIITCFYGAYLLRFDRAWSPLIMQAKIHALPLVVASCLLANFLTGIYRGQWRLISVADLPHHILGVCGGVVLSLALVMLTIHVESSHSYSVYVIFGLLLLLAQVGSRLSFRFLDALFFRQRAYVTSADKTPVLIYGAGKAGKLLHDEVVFNPQMRTHVIVGFVDDDTKRVGRKLCGIPIQHGPEWLRQPWHHTPEIWISSQFISDKQACQLADQWPEKAAVRRLKLQMEFVSDGRPGFIQA